MRPFLLGAIAAPIMLVILALILGLGGFLPVAATHEDSALTRWFLHSTYQQAVARKAASVSVPDTLDRHELILQGARNFTSMCRGCHTPPGEPATAVSQGLNPPAPDMNTLLQHRTPAEAFVVLRDGVRMTGMAAFGPSHKDEELWSLVAFLKETAGATAEQYRALVREARATAPASGDGHHHAHSGSLESPADDTEGDGHAGHHH